MDQTLLKVDELKVIFQSSENSLEAVNEVSFEIKRGETVAIVGESGSGKSVSALSILQLLESTGQIASGQIIYNDLNLADLTPQQVRQIRGKEIAMIFQDPMSCLDPVYTIGNQIIEAIKIHEDLSREDYRKRALELLQLVGLPDLLGSYPHQLCGGQRQRIMIAIALACRPNVLIADEPTTALDVTIQAQIMELLKSIQKEFGTSIILVTHDLAVVAEMADRVVVLYAGQLVEQSDVQSLFDQPEHPYTEALLRSIAKFETDRTKRLRTIKGSVPSLREMPTGCRFHPRCPYAMDVCKESEPPLISHDHRLSRCWLSDKEYSAKRNELVTKVKKQLLDEENNEEHYHNKDLNGEVLLNATSIIKHYPIKRGVFAKTVGKVRAVDGLSLSIRKGETLGLVGESGCGKSTTGRLITGLIELTEGEVTFDGTNLKTKDRKVMKSLRQRIQFVFQDPYSSLDPRMTVEEIVSEPLEIHNLLKGKEKQNKVIELLEKVGLSHADIQKYPHQFSGGQRQRICIARALATEPDLLICDEAVSALDVSVQAQILNLLKDLQRDLGLSYLFISHDLNVVKYISDRVCVMYLGEIVELTDPDQLFTEPLHPYSQALISAIPIPDPLNKSKRLVLKGEVPSPANPPSGCKFHTRCPHAMDVCKTEQPVFEEVRNGQLVACHLYR